MNYLDARVSRNLAFCALALFGVNCLTEIAEVVETGSVITRNQDIIVAIVDLPRAEEFFLVNSAATLRAVAVVHGTVAAVLLVLYGLLTRSFAARPGFVKAAALSGILAFLPVTWASEQGTRLFVDAQHGRHSYDKVMAKGDGTSSSSNRRSLMASSVLGLGIAWTIAASEREGLDVRDSADDERGREIGEYMIEYAVDAVVLAVGAFRLAWSWTFHATAALLFAWSARAWWMRRRIDARPA